MEQLPDSGPGTGGILAKATAEAEALARDTHAVPAARGLAIAALLEEIRAEPEIRAAAILYPLVEAGAITSEAVEKRFDPIMRRRVEEIQRLGSFGLPENWRPGNALPPPQAETLRKMLLAIVADVRLVLVRLADQLHRLHSARDAEPEELERVATETREIFAPLANRLGIWHFKWQMEDLSFRYLEPETYRGIALYLKETREDRERRIEQVLRVLREELAKAGINGDIEGRPKHIYSIWKKMRRKHVGIDQVFDISAVRVLVDTVPECYAALGHVHSLWPYISGEFDDYIANPKGNFYRSLHTAVMGPGNQPLEIQIRTREMHEHANSVSRRTGVTRKGVAAIPPSNKRSTGCDSSSHPARTPRPTATCSTSCAPRFSRTVSMHSRRPATSSIFRQGRRRWISPTRCTPISVITAAARGSTVASSSSPMR